MSWKRRPDSNSGETQAEAADAPSQEQELVIRIRRGEAKAWEEFIALYEGRLLAYVEHRLSDRSQAEDIVQETLIGFLNSLPNYDGARSLENYLFSICAYKLTDHLRKLGRHSLKSLEAINSACGSSAADRLPGRYRGASSLVRSHEQQTHEEHAIRRVLFEQIAKWQAQKDWLKLSCLELLIVGGKANREVAALLEISEQKVANYKADFIARTRVQLERLQISSEVFHDLLEN
jgi:RNA polymerase sigma-70 factor (ECF subfamily)